MYTGGGGPSADDPGRGLGGGVHFDILRVLL
jgi:hypothetical protein